MTEGWVNRIVGHGEVNPEELLANPRNFRIHPKSQQDALSGVMADIGIVRSVTVNQRTGFVVDGHLRVELALSQGQSSIPVEYVDLSEAEEAEALASIDPLSAMAVTDKAKLDELLREVQSGDSRVQQMLAELAAKSGLDYFGGEGETTMEAVEPDLDRADELREIWQTEPGQLWRIGEHRLLIGDATDAAAMDRLMAGVTATMSFTDPPWNVAIGGDGNPRHRQRTGLENDNLSDEDFAAFIVAFAAQMHRCTRGDIYAVLGASEWPTLDLALRTAGFHWSATIIWVKDLFVLGRSKYHRRYEPLWYGWSGKGKSSYSAGRDQDDVWEIPRPRVSSEHPTMKPVALVRRAIENSSERGDIVLDQFLGSGTTMAAAAEAGRRCYGMELAPKYAAVTLQRMKDMGWQTEEVS